MRKQIFQTADQIKIERFEGIYFRTRRLMYAYIQKFVPVEDSQTEDVLQECYIRLWENLDRIAGAEDPIALLRTYAINFSINHLKKAAKQKLRERAYSAALNSVSDTETEMERRSTVREYRRILDNMPSQRRIVFQLVKENNFSYKEISQKLGISTKTIERHVNEALRTLRNKIPAEQIPVILILGSNAFVLGTC